MKRLTDLLSVLPRFDLVGSADQPITGLQYWLDDLAPGEMFVAIPGHPIDGHDRIGGAVATGAAAILCERIPEPASPDVPYVVVPDSIVAMGLLAHAFHGRPSERMRVVGVTGTNGKTSTANLLHRLFRALGHRAGLLSNIRDWINDESTEARYTTGHALFLSEMMGRMADADCRYCFMEVSSHGIEEQRIAGIRFAGAIFTNLTQDHLDYHGSMAAYAAAKKAWFNALPTGAFALTNADDPRGAWMLKDSAARRLSYGQSEGSDYRVRIDAATLDGLSLHIAGRAVRSPLLGGFNAWNLAACYAAACELGEEPGRVAAALATLSPVEGRMEAIRAPDGRTAIVDYANTPDAVEQVLRHLRASKAEKRRIITVIGCGGGGDVSRRPLMAKAAAELSDRLILTTDNARWEDPETIVATMVAGVGRDALERTTSIPDRHAAIREACGAAGPGDLILIAGKGHERYLEIGGIRTPFDDRDEARAAFGIEPPPRGSSA